MILEIAAACVHINIMIMFCLVGTQVLELLGNKHKTWC